MSSSNKKDPPPLRPSKSMPSVTEVNGQFVEITKSGTISRMRSHKGNKPVLPQTQLCHLCPAKFTRVTHLHRHLRTHSSDRMYGCDRCGTKFHRSDLLTRHKRTCGDPTMTQRSRRRACKGCADGKAKCDLKQPCSRCMLKAMECAYDRPSGSPSGDSPPQAAIAGGSRSRVSRTPHLRPPGPTRDFSLPASLSTPVILEEEAEGARLFEPFDDFPGWPSHNTFHDFRTYTEPSVGTSYTESSVVSDSHSYFDERPGTSYGGFAQDALALNQQLNTLLSEELLNKFYFSLDDSPAVPSILQPYANPTPGPTPSIEGQDYFSGNVGDFPFATSSIDMQPFMASGPPPLGADFHALHNVLGAELSMPSPLPAPSNAPIPPSIPYPSEFQQYMHLFYNMFLAQMPIMHIATFTIEGKPPVLLSAMQACGALYARTPAAASFIDATLASAREELVIAFARNPQNSEDQVHLILAVVLLQTIGLFHQRSEQRAQSNIYHSMLVMMIRQSGLIAKVSEWRPPNIDRTRGSELDWHQWAFHETTKRALLLSYLHDTCHCIYFTLRPTFLADEMTVPLPCEDAIWSANSYEEWKVALLSRKSAYGPQSLRLRSQGLQDTLAKFADVDSLDEELPVLVTPFAHFVLAHAILRKLFADCVDKDPSDSSNGGYIVQFMLHKWLKSWLASPETPRPSDTHDPIFLHDALPFYWIAQVTLLAHQENLLPFSSARIGEDNKGEGKFRLVKEWLRIIREFLRKGEQGPTLFWDELIKIRMKKDKGTVSDGESLGGTDQSNGLLGFFAET